MLVAVQLSVAQSIPPVKIILDTDMASDCDDLGAVAVLHALANQGKAEILGMVCNVSDTNSPYCLRAVNTFYGRPDIPIGYLNSDSVNPTMGFPYNNKYTDYIATNYPHIPLNAVRDALDVYTNLLSTNTGVTIVSIGSMTNLDRLLQSAPDLVRNKVTKLVVMGGLYPLNLQQAFDYNFSLAPFAAVDVAANWPTPIVFTGLGGNVITGTGLFDDTRVATNNPIRWGYDLGTRDARFDNVLRGQWPWVSYCRPSWDQIAVLYAVEGVSTNFIEVGNGANVLYISLAVIDNIPLPMLAAYNNWVPLLPSNHSFLWQLVSDNVLAARIEALMTQQPIPRVPSNLSAIAISTNEIDLTWQRNADNEDGYDIERSTDGINFDLIGFTMGAITTSFADDTGLNPCTTYYYRVRAYNSSGNSDFSNIANATTVCGPNDGLVAYYPFHGNANDESGNGHNGVNLGAVLTTDRFGKTNGAYSFDGSSIISLDTNRPLTGIHNQFSISLWFLARDTAGGDLYDHRAAFRDIGLSWSRDTPRQPGAVQWEMTDHSGAGHVVASTVQPLNTWIHCVASYDGDTQRLYINGLLADSSSGVGIFDWDEAFFSEGISGHQYDPGNPMDYRFNGKIDDVRIYNRALSADEIQQLYGSEGGLNAGLVAYYPFNDNANDESGHGHDGINHGAVPTMDRFGNANTAYYFNGQGGGQYVEIPASSELDNRDFAICAWIKPQGPYTDWPGGTVIDRLWSDWDSNSTSDVLSLYIDQTSKPTIYYNFDGQEGMSSQEYFSLSWAAPINAWFHLCVCKSGAQINSFVNGAITAVWTLSADQNPYANSAQWLIGSQMDYGHIWMPFRGSIDDVRIYNRALSASEVWQLYTLNWQPTLGAICQGGNLIFSWPTNVPTFTLVSATNLGPSAVWTPVSNEPVEVNGQFFVTNSLSEPSMFFRLKGP